MDVREPGLTRTHRSAGLMAGAAGVVVLLAVGLVLRDRVTGVDVWGLEVLRLEPGGTAEMVVAGLSDGLRIAAVATAAIAIGWLLWRGRAPALPSALGHLVLFLVLAASSELLKEVIGRPHPGDPADYSYPSTHVAMVTTALIVAASVLTESAPRSRRPYLVVLAGVVVLATAATRVALAEHHITDVAGTVFGYTGLGLLGAHLLRRMSAHPVARLTPPPDPALSSPSKHGRHPEGTG